MRKLIEQCPACGGEMIVTQQSCTRCETVVLGRFKPDIFSRLSPESLNFIIVFVKNRGNIKEMERELGLSYWTIRNRLNEVIAELGFETRAEDAAATQPTLQRQDILARLESGELTVEEATARLEQLRLSAS
ncbi:MAG: DUF2089 domain-containing protein [Chloroflexi bacterium]|nr:DUF2089 domain-containing protein [Chloroflexota bacterium]MBP8056398.1 DUF2089 domain-containing protein [Chloroflexota bacterium]